MVSATSVCNAVSDAVPPRYPPSEESRKELMRPRISSNAKCALARIALALSGTAGSPEVTSREAARKESNDS